MTLNADLDRATRSSVRRSASRVATIWGTAAGFAVRSRRESLSARAHRRRRREPRRSRRRVSARCWSRSGVASFVFGSPSGGSWSTSGPALIVWLRHPGARGVRASGAPPSARRAEERGAERAACPRCSGTAGSPRGALTWRPPWRRALTHRGRSACGSAWPRAITAASSAGSRACSSRLQSGIGAFDDRMLSDHMVQHLLLLEFAPLLLLAGRPGPWLLRSLPRPGARSRAPRSAAATGHAAARLPGDLLHGRGGTHVPAFYDATLDHRALHDARACPLPDRRAVLMWWPMVDGDPMPRPAQRPRPAGLRDRGDAADDPDRRLPVPGRRLFYAAYAGPGARARRLGRHRPAAGGGDHVGGRRHADGRWRACGRRWRRWWTRNAGCRSASGLP